VKFCVVVQPLKAFVFRLRFAMLSSANHIHSTPLSS
jgi:hypothetical protein